MKKIRSIILLLITTYLLSFQSEIFGKFSKDLNNLNRSIESLNEGHKKVDFYDDHKGAIENFTEAIKQNPKNIYAFFSRAYSRNMIQDIPGALDDLNIVLEIDPSLGVAYYNRAIINAKLVHKFSSIRDYSKAINKNIELKHAYAGRGILNQILVIFKVHAKIGKKQAKTIMRMQLHGYKNTVYQTSLKSFKIK